MAWQQNWSQPLNNFTMPAIPTQSQMGPYNPMQFNPTMTPEQHFAMQQNWQQWQTYQQQYAQWQATYGEKYQQEMQQKFNQNTTAMPPIVPQGGQISSMPAISHLPPPPPNQPAPLPPPPPESEAFKASSNANDQLNHRSFQATIATGSINRTSNFITQPSTNQPYNRGVGGGINQNQFSGNVGRNKFESLPTNATVTNDFIAKPLNPISEGVTDKTPEEKAFDEQFQKWEEEFASWKLQNANHPDTRAYKEYEQKMEECRTKLLERREQMKRRKLELLQQQQQKQQPIQATSISQEKSRTSNDLKFSGYTHSNVPLEKIDFKDKEDSGDVQQLLENSSNKSQLFMRGSNSSGIPGLDLVVDDPNDNANVDVNNDTLIINDDSPKREDKTPQQDSNIQQRPDLEAISRGITSILGDPNLVSLLSNFQPKSIPNPVVKSAIPSLLDMKMPDIDLDNVTRFNWRDEDDDDGSVSSAHQRQDLSTDLQSNENTQPNSNQLNDCDDQDQYDDDFDANREHERFAEMNYEDSNNDERPFQMNRGDNDNFSKSMMNSSRDGFNRNMMQNSGNNFVGSSNFMNENDPNDNFNANRSNYMNDNNRQNDFNRLNFTSDNFNQNRSNFNENMRGGGNNSFRNAGKFNHQNSFNFQGNRTNPFDTASFGNNSNFNNDRNSNSINFQQRSNFNGNNNFGQSFSVNDQCNNENNEFNNTRNDDRNFNMNDFSRRRNCNSNDDNYNDFDGPNYNASNSQVTSNFRNNNWSDDNNQNQNKSQFTSVQNRGLPTDSFISDNANDEDFFRPTKVIDYSANSKKPTQITATTDNILMPMKVVDYGHQTQGIVSRPQNASHPRPVNKYTGGDFFPVKTIDYNHSSNKHMIKEYYYSIVSKWDPASSNTKSLQSQQVPHKTVTVGTSSNNEAIKRRIQPAQSTKAKELKEITYEQLSSINTATKQGKKLKRALIKKRSTVNDYPIGHKFYPSVKWQLLNEENRKRPGLPTKRGNRKGKNGKIIPLNKTIPAPNVLNEYEEILSNDDDSLEEYQISPDDCKPQRKTDGCKKQKTAPIKSPSIRPARQNVVLMEDIIYNPGRQRRPQKIVVIMRGPPGSGKTRLAKLIKEKESENYGVAVRILSIDDYFKTEVDEVRKCPETGKNLNIKKMIYEYEKDKEETYMQYLMKSYKKTIVDGLFDFIIVDSIASTLRHYTEFYNFAKAYAFTPYTCEMEMNPEICFKRNIHQRTLDEIQAYCDHWSKTPEQYLKLDFDSFIQDASFDVDDN